jgi:hypothetical protein
VLLYTPKCAVNVALGTRGDVLLFGTTASILVNIKVKHSDHRSAYLAASHRLSQTTTPHRHAYDF